MSDESAAPLIADLAAGATTLAGGTQQVSDGVAAVVAWAVAGAAAALVLKTPTSAARTTGSAWSGSGSEGSYCLSAVSGPPTAATRRPPAAPGRRNGTAARPS